MLFLGKVAFRLGECPGMDGEGKLDFLKDKCTGFFKPDSYRHGKTGK